MDKSRSWLVGFLLVLLASLSFAGDLTATWEYDEDFEEVCWFKVYMRPLSVVDGFSQGSVIAYVQPPMVSAELLNVPDGNWSFAVTVIGDEALSESDFSEEFSFLQLAQHYWVEVRYDYDALGRVLYKGEHYVSGVAETDPEWWITRYYYDSNGRVVYVRMRQTSWSSRTEGW